MGDFMKICVFADVHGNSQAWLNMYKKEKDSVDCFFFLGDIFGYFYDQSAIIKDFMADDRIVAIKGDHDEYYLKHFCGLTGAELKSIDDVIDDSEDIQSKLIQNYGCSYRQRYSRQEQEYMKKLPEYYLTEADGRRIALFHGGPGHYLEQMIYPDTEMTVDSIIDTYEEVDVMFLGNTHYRMDRMRNNCRVINPGSLGQPRDGMGFSYGIYDTVSGEFEFRNVEADMESLIMEASIFDGDTKMYDYLVEMYGKTTAE